MTTPLHTGRVHQKERTRTAIVDAARDVVAAGSDLGMAPIAARAGVSEATAYRYFPDLASLLAEAVLRVWPSADEVLLPVAHLADPVVRVAHATESMLRDVHAYEGAVRAMIAASIIRPATADARPLRRFALIDAALAPFSDSLIDRAALAGESAVQDQLVLAQLKLDLAVVVSAEAYFNLTDLCGLSPDDAIASATQTARTLVAAAVATITATTTAAAGDPTRNPAGDRAGDPTPTRPATRPVSPAPANAAARPVELCLPGDCEEREAGQEWAAREPVQPVARRRGVHRPALHGPYRIAAQTEDLLGRVDVAEHHHRCLHGADLEPCLHGPPGQLTAQQRVADLTGHEPREGGAGRHVVVVDEEGAPVRLGHAHQAARAQDASQLRQRAGGVRHVL